MVINGIKIILFTRVNVIGGGVPLLLPAMTFTKSLLIFLAEPPVVQQIRCQSLRPPTCYPERKIFPK